MQSQQDSFQKGNNVLNIQKEEAIKILNRDGFDEWKPTILRNIL